MRQPPDLEFYPLTPAFFCTRPNRFVIRARVGGRVVRAACRDPGRLRELLRPGVALLLEPSRDPRRRTRFTAVLVRHRGRWVSLIPALANRVFEAALGRRATGLPAARVVRREVTVGRSRIDFEIEGPRGRALVEVKSATLVEAGRALFPDAPTVRGTRHVRELIAHRRIGGRAQVVFVVQRSDATSLSPHAANDPAFAEALREARRAGAGLLAFACHVSPRGIRLDRRIPVVL
jgi:sugar fermentation stimulation protein A